MQIRFVIGDVVGLDMPVVFDLAFIDKDPPAPTEGQSKFVYLRLRQFDGHGAGLPSAWLDA